MEQADYTPSTKAYDTISYISITKLAEKLSFSRATLDRILNGDKYKDYLTADKEKKIIKLNTSFKAGSITQPFVCLTETEISFLRKHHDNKLCNYLIYMKYYCGMCKNTGQNFTAEQFLTNCGYSTRANSNYDDLSRYNKLLEDAGIITIIRYRDDDKKKRNTYKYNQSYLYLSQDR
jgi:hypothetical protein